MADQQTFRVHDAADDLVDDLVVRARAAVEDLEAHLERITATRDAVRAFLATIRATPKPTIEVDHPGMVKATSGPFTPAPGTVVVPATQVATRPKAPPATAHKAGALRAAAERVTCPECGQEMSRMGRRGPSTAERQPVAA